MKTLLIYDLEASGLRSLDQVLSYASIRTNLDLEIIEKTSIEVAWRRDMIPSAEAYLVHHIGLFGRETVSEGDAIQKIHAKLNQDNTLSGGYNTLGFDDELLRFSFYRCLLPPYTHQYQNGCGRFDILPMVVFYYLYAPEVIQWPIIEGKPSFKLENLNRENKWVEGRSHEAMVDVEATLALMQALKQKQEMWEYLLGFFDKQVDQKRTYELLKFDGLGILVSLYAGYDNDYQVPIKLLGPHPEYKNQMLLLRLDEPLEGLAEEVLQSLVIRKKLGEPGFILPYRAPYKDRLKTPIDVIEKNMAFLKGNSHVKEACMKQSYQDIENVDIDVDLYQKGFMSYEETQWAQAFHQGLEHSLMQCPSDHLQQRALRYLWRYHPDRLPEAYAQAAQDSIFQYLTQSIDHRNKPGLRIDEALAQVVRARNTTTDDQLLKGLDELEARIKELAAMIVIQHT